MRTRHVGRMIGILTATFLLANSLAEAAEPSHTVLLYAMGLGIDGEVGIGQRTADIDVSAAEVFDHLEFGAMGSYRYESDPWSFQTDVIYASLAGEKTGARGFARATVDLDQAMIEVDAGYRLGDNVELMFGTRYWDYGTEIALFGSGPAGTAQRASDSKSWVDPLVGLRFTIPLGANWKFIGRGDIGGFDVGSQFAWHATAFFDWSVASASASCSAIASSTWNSRTAQAPENFAWTCSKVGREPASRSLSSWCRAGGSGD